MQSSASDVQKFESHDIAVVTYNQCAPVVRAKFEEWIGSMNRELDGERGAGPDGVLEWVRMQNALFEPDGIYQTYISIYKPSGEIVATGSIVPDDRDVRKTYRIDGDGVWGFHNVRRDLRSRGLGKICQEHHDQLCAEFARRVGRDVIFAAFTANPVSAGMLEKLGFRFARDIYVAAFDCNEKLYTKTYKALLGVGGAPSID